MATSALPLAELSFLSPTSCPKRRLSLSKFRSSRQPFGTNSSRSISLRMRINAVKEEGAVIEDKEREFVDRLNGVEWTGNGAATATSGTEYSHNESVERSVNGAVGVIESGNGATNGSLAKYANGNGVAATEVVEDVEVEASKLKEDGRKKRLEEIGKEEAWFKQSGKEMIEVAVAPGGRWSRFKTYSTIQRTLEIWGFVISFIFKSWLNNQKFTYRGQRSIS